MHQQAERAHCRGTIRTRATAERETDIAELPYSRVAHSASAKLVLAEKRGRFTRAFEREVVGKSSCKVYVYTRVHIIVRAAARGLCTELIAPPAALSVTAAAAFIDLQPIVGEYVRFTIKFAGKRNSPCELQACYDCLACYYTSLRTTCFATRR